MFQFSSGNGTVPIEQEYLKHKHKHIDMTYLKTAFLLCPDTRFSHPETHKYFWVSQHRIQDGGNIHQTANFKGTSIQWVLNKQR
jgi:hypothetical protein